MKKFLLLALAATSMMSVSAKDSFVETLATPAQQKQVEVYDSPESAESAASRSDETSYTLSFCGDIYSWGGMHSSKSNYRMYIYIPADLATSMAGDQITSVYYSTALLDSYKNGLSGSIFVYEDIDGDPVTSTEITVNDCYYTAGSNSTYYYSASFDEPYTIKEGQGFYYGYTVEGCLASNGDYPLGYDSESPGEYAGYFDVITSGKTSTYSMADIGCNLCMMAGGYGKGLQNYFTITPTGYVDGLAYAFLEDATDVRAWIYVKNNGSNKLTTMTYQYSVNGGDVVESTDSSLSIASGGEYYLQMPISGLSYGVNNIELIVSQANGVDVNTTGNYYLYNFAPDETRYSRKFVVEEATGTWCGYCPRGIVGMEYMEENYPDDFVGIAIHGSDSFQSDTYYDLIPTYFSGYPSCIINRESYYIIDPNWKDFEEYYQQLKSPSNISMELEGYLSATKEATVTLHTTFTSDIEDANYLVAFAVLEDDLSARQTNYYSGATDTEGLAGDWTSYSSSYRWTYSNTARDIFDLWGIEDLIPNSIQADTEYSCSYAVDLSSAKKVANTSIVALVLDGATGVILNAEKIYYDTLSEAGITDVMDSDSACSVIGTDGQIVINGEYSSAKVYNMAGQQVGLSGLASGVYVVNIDGKAHKVLVK